MEKQATDEFAEMQRNCEPDDSVSVPQYEGTPPDEAAGIAKILAERMGKMSIDEKQQYEASQVIADKAGILIDDIDETNCKLKGALS